ncbi:hypothetical protein CJU89_4788 [Yarrowia sp. B02]|nr:hypothetical protein CJU89_4788 [Yarrowia sp. B02]
MAVDPKARASSEDTAVEGDAAQPPDLRPRPLRDDSNRGKRLMGSLLGSLQGGRVRRNAPGGGDVTKSEIEQRIRNRRANLSNTQDNQALKETIWRKRRERRQLEMTKRHEKMRQDARCLQTLTKPSITYLPRVLTPEDSAQIKEQCAGVEYDIQRELAEHQETS